MKNKPLTLICVQPCIKYYAWQVEVMLNNFKRLGITEKYDVQCLFAYNKNEFDWEDKVSLIKKVEHNYKDCASFYYYEDTRVYPISYISSIRPNVLKQHFKEFAELTKQPIFYHDCDIVFTKFPDFFEKYINDDNWYVSDTISYIGYDYIISKGEDVLDKMCDIVGIDKELVKSKQNQSGGAQYLLKNVDFSFFNDMEVYCETLFKEITMLNEEKIQLDRHTMNEDEARKPYHPLQIWCADMWAILWCAWLRGYETIIIPELDFCWATDNIEKWDNKYIFHNAGVVDSMRNEYFYKADYRDKYPYEIEGDNYDKGMASFKYFEEIKKIGNKSCLL